VPSLASLVSPRGGGSLSQPRECIFCGVSKCCDKIFGFTGCRSRNLLEQEVDIYAAEMSQPVSQGKFLTLITVGKLGAQFSITIFCGNCSRFSIAHGTALSRLLLKAATALWIRPTNSRCCADETICWTTMPITRMTIMAVPQRMPWTRPALPIIFACELVHFFVSVSVRIVSHSHSDGKCRFSGLESRGPSVPPTAVLRAPAGFSLLAG